MSDVDVKKIKSELDAMPSWAHKEILASENPGTLIEVDAEEAEELGLTKETALTEEEILAESND